MENDIVTVIVPVFNVENYLNECIDSILNQTFNNLEIICVNDGSTDNSLKILNEYKQKDDRINIISQENKGLSAARNAALEIAHGKYVLFLDSDDYLDLDTISKLYQLAEDKNLDLIFFKLINFYDNTNEFFTENYYEMKFLKDRFNGNVFSYKDILKDIIFNLNVTACAKFFNRDLISNIKFLEGYLFEDNLFTIEYMFKANRICFLDEHLYKRRVRKDSITTSGSKRYVEIIEIYNIIIDKIKKFGYYEDLKEILFDRKVLTIYNRFKDVDEEYKEFFFQNIKEDFKSKLKLYENEINFDDVNPRHKFIFYSALDCDTYKEFEKSVDFYDINNRLVKCNQKLKELEKENKSLKKDLNSLLNSKSWKITKPLRKLTKLK